MRGIAIITTALVIFVWFLVSLYTYVVLQDLYLEKGDGLITVLPAISPLVLLVGVTVGLLTFWNHRKQHAHDTLLKESAFFFDECIRRYEGILEVLNGRSADPGQYLPSYIAVGAADLEQICSELSDIDELQNNIRHSGYRNAFQKRELQYKSKMLGTFHRLHENNLAGWHWGGDKGLADRLETYNRYVSEEREKIDSSEDDDQFRRRFVVTPPGTPFPRGISPSVLDTLMDLMKRRAIEKARGGGVVIVKSPLNIEEPSCFVRYRTLCKSVVNRDGELHGGM